MATKEEKAKLKAEEAALAEQQVFGAGDEPVRTADEVGVVQDTAGAGDKAPVVKEPTSTSKSTGANKPETVTISREQFESFMNRLSDLEGAAMSSSQAADDIFNPLAEVKSDHVVKVAFHGDLLVVGYKEKVRPDGKKVYTWLKKDEASGEIRTYVTLLLLNLDTDELTEETVDYIGFIEQAVTLDAVIKERKDIGKLVEHGLVTQMTWNGRALVPTSQKIMTGAKEQKFIFKVLLKGKLIEMPENVVNIKA